jgi:hypothetical protein
MNKKEDAIVVFTARSPERLVREGGSQAWLLNPARAKQCTWLVCTQNRHNPNHEFSDATEPHGAGFLLGKISGVHKSLEEGDEDRWIIEFSEFARIDYPDLWDHGRNPVRYTSLERLEIDTSALKWEPMPEPQSALAPVVETPSAAQPKAAVGPLTMAEAKKGLALTFNVPPEAIEITIRG